MFDRIKTFARGLSIQGHPSQLSPDSLLPYTNAVLFFLEDGHQRFALRNAICSDEDEYLWFEFSYDALALSMASALARANTHGDEAKHRYVNTALSAMARAIGETKPEYLVGQMASNTAELDHLYSIWKLAGADCSKREFILTKFSYGQFLDTVYPSRALEIIKIMSDCVEQRLGSKDHVIIFIKKCARHFLGHVTHEPTAEKEAAIASAIVKLFFSLRPSQKE